MLKKCLSCGITYSKEADFCPICGEKLVGLNEDFTFVDYEYKLDKNKKAEITSCNIKNNIIKVPSEIDGHPVISIGEFAFSNIMYIDEVIVEEGILYIKDSAFYNCSLKHIVLPKTLLSIGGSNFSNNYTEKFGVFEHSKIETIFLPDSLIKISDGCFRQCINLVDVRLPNKIKEIPFNCFKECKQLKKNRVAKFN